MKISKAIMNYAARRSMEIEIDTQENEVRFWDSRNDCEWMFSYSIGNEGLHWKGNIYLPLDVKEELPAMIATDKKLKEVIDFVAKEFVSREVY
ncbi:hypothetical protein GS157_002903 [Salmonella enterica]|nr:hypothetical protein [Salmonella enterica]EEK5739154.1 hypothetical protein [Salmonella enterica]EEL9952910.1 hypothetical protein [Salmonella enterica]EEM1605848.1 hypothetical protein [Salmonella enterica]